MGFSLRVNHKCLPSTSPAERNAQFEFIDRLRQDCADRNTPISSIDTKKKELGGRFRNAGVSWQPTPVLVNDHDFRSLASGLAVPTASTTLLRTAASSVSASPATPPSSPSTTSLPGGPPQAAPAIPTPPSSSASPIAAAATATATAPGSTPSSTISAISTNSK